jgi:hypothetical protein
MGDPEIAMKNMGKMRLPLELGYTSFSDKPKGQIKQIKQEPPHEIDRESHG